MYIDFMSDFLHYLMMIFHYHLQLY